MSRALEWSFRAGVAVERTDLFALKGLEQGSATRRRNTPRVVEKTELLFAR